MKTAFILATVIAAAALSACGKKEETPAPAAPAMEVPAAPAMEAPAAPAMEAPAAPAMEAPAAEQAK